MPINSLSPIQSTPFTGLETQTYNVQTAGTYTVEVDCTIPYRASGQPGDSTSLVGASALQLLVKLDATTKLTLSSPTPTQPSLSGSVTFAATAGQVITVVPSSANAVDAVPNAVKGIINVFLGV
jgi:hypothetical protein